MVFGPGLANYFDSHFDFVVFYWLVAFLPVSENLPFLTFVL